MDAFLRRSGSLLVSSSLLVELDTVRGDARTRAKKFFTQLGEHWILINPVTSVITARESRDEIGAYVSLQALKAYVLARSEEVRAEGTDFHSLTDREFFDLSRTLAWSDEMGAQYAARAADEMAQLKIAARERAQRHEAEQRLNRNAYETLYPSVPISARKMAHIHNAVWREVARRGLERTWMPNDGFDIAHLLPAMAIGGYIAVDSDWRRIGEAATTDLPVGHYRLYRPGQLKDLVADIAA